MASRRTSKLPARKQEPATVPSCQQRPAVEMTGDPLPGRLHAEALLALATTLLLSIPSAKHLISSLTRKPPRQSRSTYEDRDGQSRPEDVLKFSTRTPRVLAALFAAAGCFASICLAALDARASRALADVWLYSAAWVCAVNPNQPALR